MFQFRVAEKWLKAATICVLFQLIVDGKQFRPHLTCVMSKYFHVFSINNYYFSRVLDDGKIIKKILLEYKTDCNASAMTSLLEICCFYSVSPIRSFVNKYGYFRLTKELENKQNLSKHNTEKSYLSHQPISNILWKVQV